MNKVISGVNEENTRWLTGEETEQIRINYNVAFQRTSPFTNLRLITTAKITPKIIKQLESGSPYGKEGTEEDKKYSQMISMSITENLCDKLATPYFIHNFETQTLPYPFPEEKAAPLSQNTKVENELLDDPEYINNH